MGVNGVYKPLCWLMLVQWFVFVYLFNMRLLQGVLVMSNQDSKIPSIGKTVFFPVDVCPFESQITFSTPTFGKTIDAFGEVLGKVLVNMS